MQQRASTADLKEQEKDSINLKIGHFKIFREECKKILKSKTNKKTNKKQVSYRTPSQEMIFLLWHPRKSTQRKWQNSYLKKVKVKSLSRVLLFATPWTVAYQTPPSMGFSRQQYWSGLPFPSPGDLPNPGIKPGSPTLQAYTLPSEPPGNVKVMICQITQSKNVLPKLKIIRVKTGLQYAKIKPSLKCICVCVDVFLKGQSSYFYARSDGEK